MSTPPLTPRLKMVLSLVPETKTCCDVGTDHGYIAIALAQAGCRVIASDINSGPLTAAKRSINRLGLEGKIDLRLSDGLSAIQPGEADCAVIAGMGGELIAGILATDCKGIENFVLQPQSSFKELREFLNTNGFYIEDEDLCREGRRFYTAMKVRRGKQRPFSEGELQIGPVLIQKKHHLLAEYLAFRRHEPENALEKMGNAQTPRRSECEKLIETYDNILEALNG